MAAPIAWTPVADSLLLQMRAAGLSWRDVATHLQVGRNAAIERARRLGLPPITHRRHAPKPAVERIDRPALCPGHPLTWAVITANSPLEGQPYPVFL